MPPSSTRELAERRVGATLRDKYRIERVLGVGGMATVYLGVHRNGHKVAVKILHPELSKSATQRERFIHEGYVANSIEHPGAVRVLDDDVAEDGCPFLVIELLDGENLEQRRRRGAGKLDVREVLAIGHALCDALAAAHDKGVIHRDIKPENVFIRGDGTLKILDFGIAKVASEETALGGLAGTPAFMPPEQALGDIIGPIDGRADLWAAGATMFTLLTGRFVHDASRTTEFLTSTVTKSAPPIREIAPDVPEVVASVIDTALAYDREDRFFDAREMRDAIGDAHLKLFGEQIGSAAHRGPTNVLSMAPNSMTPPPHSHRSSGLSLHKMPHSSRHPQVAISMNGAVPPTLPGQGAETLAADDHHGRDDSPPSISGSINTSGPESTIAPPTLSGHPPPRPARSRAILAAAAGLGMLLSLGVLFGVRAVRGPRAGLSETTTPQACVGSSCAKPGCTTNAECTAESGGKAAVCRKSTGVCVQLETPQCKVVADKSDIDNDATIWIGAMYPYGPKGSPYGKQAAHAIELGQRDFRDLGGIPPVSIGGKPRPLGVILCDDSETAAIEPAAKHLVDNVGVPVVLGFAKSKEVLDLANGFFLPKSVFALASNTASMLADIPHAPNEPRLVLRATISADMINRPKAAVVEGLLEPMARARHVLRDGEPMRIAIIRVDNASGVSHADKLLSYLHWNGKSASEQGDLVRQFVVPDQYDRKNGLEALYEMADAVAQYAPHVVIEAASDQAPFVAIERRWPVRAKFRPSYVMAVQLGADNLESLIKERPDVMRRLFNVNGAIPPAMTKFMMHHNEIFTAEKVDSFSAVSAPYDAFYVAAYAIVALGDEPITGKALARSVHRLVPPGEPIDVGPAGIYKAVKLLRDGKNVDLGGSQTTLDFDPETGDPTADFAVRCVDPRKKAIIESGLVFSAKSGKLEGTLKCP